MNRLAISIIIAPLLVSCGVQTPSSLTNTQTNPFQSTKLAVGLHPTMPTVADVNKDGHPDILVTNGGSGTVSVYLGDGKGMFSEASGSPFTVAQTPADISTADFNGDGNLDIAVAHHEVKLVSVLLGNGQGQFAPAPGSPFAVDSNPHPHGIAVADFNGDKKPDIAIDSWAENKVLVLFGKGDGTFPGPGAKFDVGRWPYQRLRTADVNEDGNADIITSNLTDSSVSVLLGDGRGSFTRKDFPVPAKPFGIAVADINGDKHLDIAIVHYSGQANDPSMNGMSVLFGDGKGQFTAANASPLPTGNYPGRVAAGDLEGDGSADVVVANYKDGTLTVYLAGRNGLTPAKYSPLVVGNTPNGLFVADLNHDGKSDIVITREQENDVLIYLSK